MIVKLGGGVVLSCYDAMETRKTTLHIRTIYEVRFGVPFRPNLDARNTRVGERENK